MITILACGAVFSLVCEAQAEMPWARHNIFPRGGDGTGGHGGPDGVRLGDFNGDGLTDIATPFEEGRTTRIFANPGPDKVREHWPYVLVSETTETLEDAFFADIDGDGQLDVVVCETNNQLVHVVFGPNPKAAPPKSDPMLAANWTDTEIPVSTTHKWLFGNAMQIDGLHGIDIIVGSCNRPGTLAWLAAPADPRSDPDGWTYHEIDNTAYWVMSIVTRDMDGDGDLDILISNRASKAKGVRWLENPTVNPDGVKVTDPWRVHVVGAIGKEAKFIAVGDLTGDGLADIVVPTGVGRTYIRGEDGRVSSKPFPAQLLWYEAKDATGDVWIEHQIDWPSNFARSGKGAAVADINGDGQNDIVVSGNTGTAREQRTLSGLVWLEYKDSPTDACWIRHEVAGPEGIKFDQVRMVDLDGDGDLDIATTVEKGPGLVWYENPTQS